LNGCLINSCTDEAMPMNDADARFSSVIVPFRKIARGRPAAAAATWLDRANGRVREYAGRIAMRLGLPGAIRDTEIRDALTGQELLVRVSPWFVKVCVDGRDYYFDRLTGRFAGTGAAINPPSDLRSGSAR